MSLEDINQLRQKFGKELVQKIEQLNELWVKYCTNPSKDNLKALQFDLHKLVGATGVYGYKAICQRLQEIEKGVLSIEKGNADLSVVQEQFASLREPGIKSESDNINIQITERDLIILIGAEPSMTERLRDDLIALNISTQSYETIEILSDHLESFADRVMVILINQDTITNLEQLDITQLTRNHPIDIILYAAESSFEKRLTAVRQEATYFYCLPLEYGLLVDTLRDLSWNVHDRSAKVLIVDDSEVFTSFYVNILTTNGISISAVNDPSKVMAKIFDYQPDLILLDLHMPVCNGIELAKIIKQHSNYRLIPIVFFSSETDQNIHIEAKAIGADQFIEKTISPKDMINHIRQLIKKHKQMTKYIETDPLTGLSHRRKLESQIITLINQYERRGETFCCALLDIDNFKHINDTYGHNIGDTVIRMLANILKSSLRLNDMVFRYGGEEFVILMPDTDLDSAYGVLDRLRDKFCNSEYYVNENKLKLSFSTGISEHKKELDAEALLNIADHNLYFAKQTGKNKVAIASE